MNKTVNEIHIDSIIYDQDDLMTATQQTNPIVWVFYRKCPKASTPSIRDYDSQKSRENDRHSKK